MALVVHSDSHHHQNAKALIGLLIVLLAFGIFLLFYTYSEEILQENRFYLFMTLTTVGMGLMVGLMYLANNSKHPSHAASTKKVTKKKKK